MKLSAYFLLLLSAACLTAAAGAATYAEVGDAGDLLSTAQATSTAAPGGGALTDITGATTLTNGVSDGDLFKIYISNPGAFSASALFSSSRPGVNNFDSQLFVFNANGQGVKANDDTATNGGMSSSPQASIPAGALTGQAAGYYYLLVDGSGRYPVDSSGNLLFPNYNDGTTDPTGVYGPNNAAAVLAGYTGASGDYGSYDLALAGAQFAVVPEFSGVGCLGAGALGLALARRLRRPRA